MVSNHVQIKIQINNQLISRRFRPEISISIGHWLNCLEILGQVNVVTNTVLLFFTHKSFKNIFIEPEEGVSKEFEINAIGWEILYFFMFLVIVEHLVIVFRLIIRSSSEVKPPFVKQGERERADLLKKFSQKKNMKEQRKSEKML